MIRVVTVGYRNPEGLTRLLDSLARHLKAPAEVVVYDNGDSRRAAEDWSRSHRANFSVSVVGQGINLGFAVGVNRAAEFDTGAAWSHLLLLNPDAYLDSDLDATETSRLASHAGVIGLRVFDDRAKRHRQGSARRFPSMMTSIAGREGWLAKKFPSNPWTRAYLAQDLAPNEEAKVDWVSGCALWVSAVDWKKLRGLDESYFLYCEDVDLGRKAQRIGLPVTYVPAVDVIHESRGSAAKAPWKSDFYHHLGMWVYHVKWAGPLGFALGPFVFVGIWLRFLVRRLAGR